MLTEKKCSLIQGKWLPGGGRLDASSARARIQATQRSNMGSFSHQPRWPQTAHFNPLHKPLCAVSARQMGGDYSNLAQSTSTSHVLTPFCHVWPPRQSATSRPKKKKKTSIRSVRLRRATYPGRFGADAAQM